MSRPVPLETVERIRRARAEGLTWSACKARFGFAPSTMIGALQRAASEPLTGYRSGRTTIEMTPRTEP